MTEDRALAQRVMGLTAGLVALIAAAAGALGGPMQAVGALAGGAVTLGNFLWLHRTAARVLTPRPAPAVSLGRRLLWLGASSLRFGIVALVLGLAAVQGWVGLPGLLVSLIALPITLVAEGLRGARAA